MQPWQQANQVAQQAAQQALQQANQQALQQANQQAQQAAQRARFAQPQAVQQKWGSRVQNRSPSSLLCPSCGIQNRPDARFCDRCGAALPAGDRVFSPAGQVFMAPAPHRSGGARALRTLFWLVFLVVVLYLAYAIFITQQIHF